MLISYDIMIITYFNYFKGFRGGILPIPSKNVPDKNNINALLTLKL